MDRAYSLLHVKSLDAPRRTFSGMASTPELDRQGHSVDPAGVSFRNPLPLLFFHDQQSPIGHVTLRREADGIGFTATLPTIETPGRLKDRVDEAWDSITAGLITGVSIGFRVLGDAVQVLKGGGLKFLKTEVFELSLVTIPANAHASILLVKSLAATGDHLPGVTGPVRFKDKDRPMKQTTAEHIASLTTTHGTKTARMTEIMETAAAAGVTLDDPQSREYDALALEVKSLDADIARLRTLEDTQRNAAVPILVPPSAGRTPVISVKANVPPGTGFIRYCQALAVSKGSRLEAVEYAKQWKDTTPEVELILKAAVAAGTTTDATWAGPLAPTAEPHRRIPRAAAPGDHSREDSRS